MGLFSCIFRRKVKATKLPVATPASARQTSSVSAHTASSNSSDFLSNPLHPLNPLSPFSPLHSSPAPCLSPEPESRSNWGCSDYGGSSSSSDSNGGSSSDGGSWD